MEQRAIRLAWETFQKGGHRPSGLPEKVLASWERCRSLGVGVERKQAPLAGEPEVFRRRSGSESLIVVARPALEQCRVFLRAASCMMIVTDSAGLILETAGDPRVLESGKRNHLETGGRWEEAAIGTNAIGTALAEGRPVQVHGAEHFCEDVQRWTCAATPVHHPLDGELLGVVDISGPVASFNPQSLALVAAVGREIEASLLKGAEIEREILLRHFVSKRSWLSEEFLIIDRRGLIVHAPQAGHRRLDAATPQAHARDIRRVISGTASETWAESCRRLFPNATLEVVEHDGHAVGCLIVLHRARSRSKAPVTVKPVPETAYVLEQILGDSPVMRETRERAHRLATNTLPILIEGETGVGKELFARAIRAASPCAGGPFVPVNCGGMARDLVASELFGYVKGAYTGADCSGRPGKIEAADGGTLCLDEIGEMPLDLQSYLLRVLEDGIVYRIGEHEGRRVDVRVLSMTNRDLIAEVEAGRFRRDLYYRIAVARLRIPPLRERDGDVLLLAEWFAADSAKRLGREVPEFAEDVLSRLRQYSWPGNVRELRNVIEVMMATTDRNRLEVTDLPPEIRSPTPPVHPGTGKPSEVSVALCSSIVQANTTLEAAERQAMIAQVRACGGNLTGAARRLGIARSTLYVRLAKYGVTRSLQS